MNAYRFAPVLGLLLLSCGVEGPAGPAGPAGPVGPINMEIITARLQPHYANGADGSRLPTGGIWDSERKEACAYGLTEKGMRCIPTATADWNGAYGDPSCIRRAWVSSRDCSTVPKYGVAQVGLVCGLGVQIFTVVPGSALYQKNGANCTLQPIDARIWMEGERVPDVDFVALMP